MSLSSLALDAFLQCAQTGSFTEASQKLYITQSALSQRVSKLEAELGTSLFIRDTSGLKLTAAGQELLRYTLAKEALEKESLSRINGANNSSLNGVLRIGGFSSVMRSVVLPSLAPLLEKNPGIKLSFITKEIDELHSLLKSGEIDYMIHYNHFHKDEIEAQQLGIEKNVLVEKKNYSGPSIFLDHDERDEATARYLKMTNNRNRYERRYLDDVYGLIDGVRLGIGRAIIPTHLVKGQKGLKVIKPRTTLDFPIILHFYKQPFYTELHKTTVNTLKENVPLFL